LTTYGIIKNMATYLGTHRDLQIGWVGVVFVDTERTTEDIEEARSIAHEEAQKKGALFGNVYEVELITDTPNGKEGFFRVVRHAGWTIR
jgi:hypothetical protein